MKPERKVVRAHLFGREVESPYEEYLVVLSLASLASNLATYASDMNSSSDIVEAVWNAAINHPDGL